MEPLDALVDQFYGSSHAARAQHLYDLGIDFLCRERFVDGAHHIGHSLLGLAQLFKACLVDGVNDVLHVPVFQQGNGGAEHAELLQAGHVDTVVIGIAYLRRTAHDDHFLGVQTVEYAQDAFLQCGSPDDAVVDDDEIVLPGVDASVGDVVDMTGKVVTAVALGDERAQLDVFPCRLLRAHVSIHYALQFLVRGRMAESFNLLDLPFVQMLREAVKHAVVSYLCRVGNVGKHGVLHVVVHGLQYRSCELFAQLLALVIDVAVGAPAEVDALERTCRVSSRRQDALDGTLAVPLHHQGRARFEFLHVFTLQVERCLQHGAFARQGHDFVVLVVECRANAPRVAHGEHLSASRNTTHHVASVEVGHRGLQDVAHSDVVFDVARDVGVRQSFGLCLGEVTFHFPVEPMAHEFEHDVRVAVDARALPLQSELLEDFIDVGHVEVPAETKVLGAPIVPP